MTNLTERKSAALKSFTAIGRKNGSAPPDSTSNNFSAAYEFMIADALRAAAGARYEAAKAVAIAEGIMQPDYTPGTHVPYTRDGLSVVAKRNNDSTTLDSAALRVALLKIMESDKVEAMFKAASKPRKGNMVFSVSME